MNNWKRIDMYEVSDDGQVFSHYSNKVLKAGKNSRGYLHVKLYKDGKRKTCLVHRLVYEVFYGEIPDGMVIDHCDANPQNNRLDNLRCVTQKENIHNHVTFPKHLEAIKKLHADPEWQRKTTEAVRKARGKSIIQIDKTTGETIKRWECARDVERELGIYNGNISECCNGKRKSAGGFKWKFCSK